MTIVAEVRSASACLFAGMWRPLASVITTLYYVAISFHRQVWYCTLSLCYSCNRSSGIIPMLPFCQIHFLLWPSLLS